MSAGWENRLAAAVVKGAFDDLTANRPGGDRSDEDNPALRRKRADYMRTWRAAAAWLYSPEHEETRRRWFAQANLPLPQDAEAMTRAIRAYSAGGPELLDDGTDADFEEPHVEEPVDVEEEAEAA